MFSLFSLAFFPSALFTSIYCSSVYSNFHHLCPFLEKRFSSQRFFSSELRVHENPSDSAKRARPLGSFGSGPQERVGLSKKERGGGGGCGKTAFLIPFHQNSCRKQHKTNALVHSGGFNRSLQIKMRFSPFRFSP